MGNRGEMVATSTAKTKQEFVAVTPDVFREFREIL